MSEPDWSATDSLIVWPLPPTTSTSVGCECGCDGGAECPGSKGKNEDSGESA